MNIGDYVRTKKGISKIIKIENEQTRKIIYTDTKDVFEYYTDYQGNEIKDYWINYSTNLKNVIEAGDVIRFIYDGVKYICNVEEELTVNLEDDMIYIKKTTDKFKLISIVTKEQFKSMEYRVGD